MQQQKISTDDAVISLAASVVDRTRELILDGWVKGHMRDTADGAPTAFCIHGALDLALEEIFGQKTGVSDVEVLAVAFIVDEAKSQYNYNGSWKAAGLAAAPFNDSASTKHEDVLSVLDGASRRLWSLGVDWDAGTTQESWTPSRWADVDVSAPEAQQFLYATLA